MTKRLKYFLVAAAIFGAIAPIGWQANAESSRIAFSDKFEQAANYSAAKRGHSAGPMLMAENVSNVSENAVQCMTSRQRASALYLLVMDEMLASE